MIKRTLNLFITLALYELGKFVAERAIVILTANDDVDTFNDYDYPKLINIGAEVSEWR